MKITDIMHPDYIKMSEEWYKYRIVYEGGKDFKDKYLYKSDRRESYLDYIIRKNISYCSAIAKSSVIEIKNSIQHRLSDVKRTGGALNFQEAISGKNGGVDLFGNSMNNFIGKFIIQELINMKRVGIFVDKPIVFYPQTKEQESRIRPYLYTYKIEDIRSWTYGSDNKLKSVLLRNNKDKLDSNTGLVIGSEALYKLYKLEYSQITMRNEVRCITYDEKGDILHEFLNSNLNQIPFIILEISQSLLKDISDHQIALTNLASADMVYAFRGNFPFYTEQYDPMSYYGTREASYNDTSIEDNYNDFESKDGTQEQSNIAKDSSIEIGPVKGRRYPKGFERPSFINPSPDPLRVSMEKQAQIDKEIRMILNLSLSNLVPQRASEESKRHDDQGMESGLSVIGSELEYAENRIAEIWSLYEGTENDCIIKYPTKYGLKTESEKRQEAKELMQFSSINSRSYHIELAKQIVLSSIGSNIDYSRISTIFNELESNNIIFINSDDVIQQKEAGLMGNEYASRLFNIPQGEVEQAKRDHEERLRRITISQSKDGGIIKNLDNPKDRGVKDLDNE